MSTSFVMRHARPEEAPLVVRLARLDSARPLRGEVILALVHDRPVAAVSLLDGRLVADPFTYTQEATDLLRAYADGLRAGRAFAHRSAPAGRGRLRPRLAH
jgi:hypothetical protein